MSLVPEEPSKGSITLPANHGLPDRPVPADKVNTVVPNAKANGGRLAQGSSQKGAGGGAGKGKGNVKGKKPWGMRTTDAFIDGPGVFATHVRGKDKPALAELYTLFNSLADELYPSTSTSSTLEESSINDVRTSKGKVKETKSIEEELEDELRELKKGERTNNAGDVERFVNIKTDTDCLLFISFKPPLNPTVIIHHYLLRVLSTGVSLLRHTHRLVPISSTGPANLPSLLSLVKDFVVPEFEGDEGKHLTWRINYNCRNSELLPRQEVTQEIPKLIGNKVELEGSGRVVLVEVFKTRVGISVVKDYDRLKKYNPTSLVAAFNESKKIEAGRVHGARSSEKPKKEDILPKDSLIPTAQAQAVPTDPSAEKDVKVEPKDVPLENEDDGEGSLDSLFADPDEKEIPEQLRDVNGLELPMLKNPFETQPAAAAPEVGLGKDGDGDTVMESKAGREVGEDDGKGDMEEGQLEDGDVVMDEGEVPARVTITSGDKSLVPPGTPHNQTPATTVGTHRVTPAAEDKMDDVDRHILASTSKGERRGSSLRPEGPSTTTPSNGRDTGGLQVVASRSQKPIHGTPTPKPQNARPVPGRNGSPRMPNAALVPAVAGGGLQFGRPPMNPGQGGGPSRNQLTNAQDGRTIPAMIPAVRSWPPAPAHQQHQYQNQQPPQPNHLAHYPPIPPYHGHGQYPPFPNHGMSGPLPVYGLPPSSQMPTYAPPPPPIPYASRPGSGIGSPTMAAIGSPRMGHSEPQHVGQPHPWSHSPQFAQSSHHSLPLPGPAYPLPFQNFPQVAQQLLPQYGESSTRRAKAKAKVKPAWKRGEPIKRDRKGCCWHCGAGRDAAGPGTVERDAAASAKVESRSVKKEGQGQGHVVVKSKKRKAREEDVAVDAGVPDHAVKAKKKKKKVAQDGAE